MVIIVLEGDYAKFGKEKPLKQTKHEMYICMDDPDPLKKKMRIKSMDRT